MQAAAELKTKATQHSVKELRAIGIQPDILLCRTDRFLPPGIKSKIALFCDVEEEAVITAKDVETVYEVPLVFHREGLDEIVIKLLGLEARPIDLSRWEDVVRRVKSPRTATRIAVVGKYVELKDSYKSLIEALAHGGIANDSRVEVAVGRRRAHRARRRRRALSRRPRHPGPRRLRRPRHRGQDRSGALRARGGRAVLRHLPGHAVRGHRVRAARVRPGRRQLLGVRARRAAPGDRPAPRAAAPGRQGRHDATGPLSDPPRRRHAGLAAVRAGDHPGAAPAPLRGQQRLRRQPREARAAGVRDCGPRSSWWRSSSWPSIRTSSPASSIPSSARGRGIRTRCSPAS